MFAHEVGTTDPIAGAVDKFDSKEITTLVLAATLHGVDLVPLNQREERQ